MFWYSNKDCYEGGWLDSCKHGKGIMQYHDGGKYEGEY